MVGKFGSAKGGCLLACTIALMLGLFGCGGGGGGGGSSSSSGGSGGSGGSSTGVAITASNAANVGGVAMAVAGGETASALSSIVGVETTTTAKPRLITRALEQVAAEAANAAATPQTVVAVVQPLTTCSTGSGTIDLASDGKSGTITFNACTDASGDTLNGTVTMTGLVVATDGSILQGTFVLSITFTEPGSPMLTMNGDFSITHTCTNTTDCTTMLAGSSLRAAFASTSLTLSNFTLTEAETSTSVATSANLTVSVTSSTINGSLTLVSTTPVVLMLGNQNASSGIVEVTGLNSKARVTVLSNSSSDPAAVRVEVDADNNGAYEINNTYPWAQITT